MTDRDLLSRLREGETVHVWRIAVMEDGERSAYEEDVTGEVIALAEQAEALKKGVIRARGWLPGHPNFAIDALEAVLREAQESEGREDDGTTPLPIATVLESEGREG